MNEEIIKQEEKKPKKKKPTAAELQKEFEIHQEYAELLFRYEKLKPDAKKKFSNKKHMEELEKEVLKMKGYKAKVKKGAIGKTVRVMSRIVKLTADYPNPAKVTELFSEKQLSHYFQV